MSRPAAESPSREGRAFGVLGAVRPRTARVRDGRATGASPARAGTAEALARLAGETETAASG